MPARRSVHFCFLETDDEVIVDEQTVGTYEVRPYTSLTIFLMCADRFKIT